MTGISNTLNINVLNSPIQRHRLVGWIKKTRPNYVVYKKHISLAKSKYEIMGKNSIQIESKAAEITRLTSDKRDLKLELVRHKKVSTNW